MSRLDVMLQMNPDFAKALLAGEPWAVQHADEINALDGNGSRRHVDRNRTQDGTRKNWCGTCPSKEGCVMCDLDGDYVAMKGMIGVWDD